MTWEEDWRAALPPKPDITDLVDLSELEDEPGIALLNAVASMVSYVDALEERIKFLEGGE